MPPVWTLDDFEQLARERMSHAAYEYVAGGAGAGLTDAENRTAFDRIRLSQRVLVDASRIDTKLRLFDRVTQRPWLSPAGFV